MQVYSKDSGWAGAQAFFANDREDALEVLKTFEPLSRNNYAKKTHKNELQKLYFASVQTLKTVDLIPDTHLCVCTFMSNSKQVVTSDQYKVGEKVVFFPEGLTVGKEKITKRRLQKVWSDGLIETCFQQDLPDETDVTHMYNASPTYGRVTVMVQVPWTDEDELNTWHMEEVKSGLVLEFRGDY